MEAAEQLPAVGGTAGTRGAGAALVVLRKVESRSNLEVSNHTASSFGVLAAAVKQAGRSPRPRYNNLWIAAKAIEHGYALLTLNASNFAGLPGLRLVTLSPKAPVYNNDSIPDWTPVESGLDGAVRWRRGEGIRRLGSSPALIVCSHKPVGAT